MDWHNITAVFMHKNRGVMWQKDLTDIISAINFFFNRLSVTSSLLGDVRNVRDTKVALPPLNVL